MGQSQSTSWSSFSRGFTVSRWSYNDSVGRYYSHFTYACSLVKSENTSQLIHMKHFEELPMAFLYDEHLSSPSSEASIFLSPLHSAFLTPCSFTFPTHVTSTTRDWRNASINSFLTAVQNARETFWTHARPSRVAFQMILLIRRFMVLEGYKFDEMVPELMRAAIRG